RAPAPSGARNVQAFVDDDAYVPILTTDGLLCYRGQNPPWPQRPGQDHRSERMFSIGVSMSIMSKAGDSLSSAEVLSTNEHLCCDPSSQIDFKPGVSTFHLVHQLDRHHLILLIFAKGNHVSTDLTLICAHDPDEFPLLTMLQ
ncbi:hypothetical protein THAOC_28655, partial [Thalassiosira oceanica]